MVFDFCKERKDGFSSHLVSVVFALGTVSSVRHQTHLRAFLNVFPVRYVFGEAALWRSEEPSRDTPRCQSTPVEVCCRKKILILTHTWVGCHSWGSEAVQAVCVCVGCRKKIPRDRHVDVIFGLVNKTWLDKSVLGHLSFFCLHSGT